jgi:hypothetical protein
MSTLSSPSSILSSSMSSSTSTSTSTNSIINIVNLEKKQSCYGFIQDIMTFGYCLVMIPLAISNIIYGQNNFSWSIYAFSYLYFVITGLINLYYLEYNFVFHHIVCLNLIFASHLNTSQEYLIWFSYCFMAEISNIFLSLKNILKHIEKLFSIQLKNINTLNNLLFFISYFTIRIFYLMPLTYHFICDNYYNLKFPGFILCNIIVMTLLNLYWGYLIIKKVQRMLNKTKSN